MAGISPTQEVAIQALLTTRTVATAAKKAGVGERTLYRWLSKDRDFRRAYRDARTRIFERAVSKLAALSNTAVDELRKILKNPKVAPRDRLTAIRTVLEHARATEEADVVALVEELQTIADQTGGQL